LVGQQNVFDGYLAFPSSDQPSVPPLALRLNWLQSPHALTPIGALQSHESDRCWLPLPITSPFSPQLLPAQTTITGCIRPDEIIVHRWSGDRTPPVWTPQGAVQWKAELVDAQLYGPAIRLLVRPQWAEQSGTHEPASGGFLEIYLSRGQWRAIEMMPGQLLLLEIRPEAIHLFH
jgi:hypothetical protein